MATDLWRSEISYLVRRMDLEDLDEVLAIERATFPLPWPASAFRYDLTRNEHAHYFVATPRRPLPVENAPSIGRRWWRSVRRDEPARSRTILGYTGYWSLVDEAHIANLAVAPAWRGRGLGELLLIRVLDHAVEMGLNVATLEVRVGNRVAQQLYRKYGFEVVGVVLGAWLAMRLLGLTLPQGVQPRDMGVIALITGMGFTVPVLGLHSALPGGGMAEAARLGLALSLLAGLVAIVTARVLRRG